jgi:hypothetical protein
MNVDDEETSSVWEDEYFKDDEVNPSMAITVVWRLTECHLPSNLHDYSRRVLFCYDSRRAAMKPDS